MSLEMTYAARVELDARLAENGWRWRSEPDARAWTSRIFYRMAIALLDPDAESGARAAREAFVDALVDASGRGAIVAEERATIPVRALPSLSLVRSARRAVRHRGRALRAAPRRRL